MQIDTASPLPEDNDAHQRVCSVAGIVTFLRQGTQLVINEPQVTEKGGGKVDGPIRPDLETARVGAPGPHRGRRRTRHAGRTHGVDLHSGMVLEQAAHDGIFAPCGRELRSRAESLQLRQSLPVELRACGPGCRRGRTFFARGLRGLASPARGLPLRRGTLAFRARRGRHGLAGVQATGQAKSLGFSLLSTQVSGRKDSTHNRLVSGNSSPEEHTSTSNRTGGSHRVREQSGLFRNSRPPILCAYRVLNRKSRRGYETRRDRGRPYIWRI